MTHPVGDQRTGRPDAVGDGEPPVPTTPTNWIIADNSLVHRGHTVRLADGRQGVITRVARDRHGHLHHHGWPEINVDGELVAVHPMRIASKVS